MTSDPLTILLRHYHWAVGLLLDRCAPLSPEQFHQRFEIGFGSLHDTLDHILGCTENWIARIKGEKRQNFFDKSTVQALRDRLEKVVEAMSGLISDLQLTAAMDMQRTVKVGGAGGQTVELTFTAGAAIVHSLVHASYHAAQAVNMLRRLGVSPLPELDVIDWQYYVENKPPR